MFAYVETSTSVVKNYQITRTTTVLNRPSEMVLETHCVWANRRLFVKRCSFVGSEAIQGDPLNVVDCVAFWSF